MPRLKTKLNKTNTKRLQAFCNRFEKLDSTSKSILYDKLYATILNDIRGIKESSEKNMLELYMEYVDPDIESIENIDSYLESVNKKIRRLLSAKYTGKFYDDCIDIYFNDVKREYINHPQNESNGLEFNDANKEIFVLNNLKLVVSVAKKFRNYGLPFADLIQAGNVGLLVAFDKFDASRDTLKKKILQNIDSIDEKAFSKDEAVDVLRKSITYSTDSFELNIPEEGFDSKESFKHWVYSNIKSAAFASVAYRWIESAIKQELNHHKASVKFPKQKNEDTYSKGNYIISLDSINPYTEDNYNDNLLEEASNEEFALEDEKICNDEREEYFKHIVGTAMSGIPNLHKRIIKKRFGIDYPTELSISEIAESEALSISEVKSILNASLAEIAERIPKSMKDNVIELFS